MEGLTAQASGGKAGVLVGAGPPGGLGQVSSVVSRERGPPLGQGHRVRTPGHLLSAY